MVGISSRSSKASVVPATVPGTLAAPTATSGDQSAVVTWVAGFDIIYACQDAEFDRAAGLHSIPARMGVAGALRLAAWLHAMTWACLSFLPMSAPQLGLSWLYGLALAIIAGLLIYQHRLVRPDDLARVNIAFFNVNAIISVLLLVAIGIDCFI